MELRGRRFFCVQQLSNARRGRHKERDVCIPELVSPSSYVAKATTEMKRETRNRGALLDCVRTYVVKATTEMKRETRNRGALPDCVRTYVAKATTEMERETRNRGALESRCAA